jgi:hypothetical protein
MVLTYKHEINKSGHKQKNRRGKRSKRSNNLCSSWVTMTMMARVCYELQDSHDGVDDQWWHGVVVDKHNTNSRLKTKRKKET